MKLLRKSQDGVFISVFAMATVLLMTIMISFMADRVLNLLANQADVFSQRHVYWLSYSGMEVLAIDRFAGLNLGPNNYSLAGGTITATGSASGLHNGGNKTNVVTSKGSDGNSVHNLKWTIGNPVYYALSFDGSNDYVDIGNVFNDVKTISFWIHADDITSNTDQVIDLNGTDYIKIVNGEVTVNNIDTPTYYVNSVSGEQTITAVDTWYHVVVTTATGINVNDMDIGRLEGEIDFMDGLIDQVALWNTTFSINQVRSLYIQGRGFNVGTFGSGNLKGYWPFENNANDGSGNSHNGTNNGATYTGS